MFFNAELDHRLNCEIMMLEHARERYCHRLEMLRYCDGAFLHRSKHGDSGYFYHIKWKGSKSYKYAGRADHPDVKRIMEARFLKEAIRRIDQDLSLMKGLKDGFLPFDLSHVSESLPIAYQCKVPPVPELYQCEGAKWKIRQLEYQQMFPENYPQHKTHRTSDGVMVKTISELVLYEKFKDAGLVFVYEWPFPPKDHGPTMYPDFAILSPVDMKSVIFVEYAGRLDLPKYREDFAKRLDRYMKNGYVPGVNLFFVYGDRDGNIDSTQITKVILDIFGIRDAQMAKFMHAPQMA
jgi:hypothetical protein